MVRRSLIMVRLSSGCHPWAIQSTICADITKCQIHFRICSMASPMSSRTTTYVSHAHSHTKFDVRILLATQIDSPNICECTNTANRMSDVRLQKCSREYICTIVHIRYSFDEMKCKDVLISHRNRHVNKSHFRQLLAYDFFFVQLVARPSLSLSFQTSLLSQQLQQRCWRRQRHTNRYWNGHCRKSIWSGWRETQNDRTKCKKRSGMNEVENVKESETRWQRWDEWDKPA